MKLYKIEYLDDCEDASYLTVGESKEEVETREAKRLQDGLACYMGMWVYEILEVDGRKIIVE
jgi:hypothetical protein